MAAHAWISRARRRRALGVLLAAAVVLLGLVTAAPARAAGPITVANPPMATAGQPYSAQLEVSGGTGPFTFDFLRGTVPPGLTISASGLVAGTPVQQYDQRVLSTVWLRVHDGSVASDHSIVIAVAPPGYQPPPPLTITPVDDVLPTATVGQPYSVTFRVTGGIPPRSISSQGWKTMGLRSSQTGDEVTFSGTPSLPTADGYIYIVVSDSGGAWISSYQQIEEQHLAARLYKYAATTGNATLDTALYPVTTQLALALQAVDRTLADTVPVVRSYADRVSAFAKCVASAPNLGCLVYLYGS